MSLLHRSTDINTDKPVTDGMASEASSTSTMDTSDRGGDIESQEVESQYRRRRSPVGHMTGALLALLLAAWAGIIPYIGPTFGFSADGSSSWTWNELHSFTSLVPGAVGVLACLLILMSARQRHGLMSSVALGTWGFVLFVCGAWLAVTPVVWPVIVGTYFHAASPSMTLAYWAGYASGPGVLLAGLGAFTMGRTRRPA